MGVAPTHNSFADCRLATWLPGLTACLPAVVLTKAGLTWL